MKTYRITGVKYSDTPTYYAWDKRHRYPDFKPVEEQEWTINAESLKEAEYWLAQNHPEYYMGAAIVRIDNDSDPEFLFTAVPSVEYPTGSYETNAARRTFVLQSITI